MIASWSSRTLQKSLGAVVATTGIGSGLLYWCEYEGTRRAMKVGRSTSQIVRKTVTQLGELQVWLEARLFPAFTQNRSYEYSARGVVTIRQADWKSSVKQVSMQLSHWMPRSYGVCVSFQVPRMLKHQFGTRGCSVYTCSCCRHLPARTSKTRSSDTVRWSHDQELVTITHK